jgi:hypothetical protein
MLARTNIVRAMVAIALDVKELTQSKLRVSHPVSVGK